MSFRTVVYLDDLIKSEPFHSELNSTISVALVIIVPGNLEKLRCKLAMTISTKFKFLGIRNSSGVIFPVIRSIDIKFRPVVKDKNAKCSAELLNWCAAFLAIPFNCLRPDIWLKRGKPPFASFLLLRLCCCHEKMWTGEINFIAL